MDTDEDVPTRTTAQRPGARAAAGSRKPARQSVSATGGQAASASAQDTVEPVASLPMALADELFSTLAHELRAPLTTIKGASRTLLRHVAVLDPAVTQQLLHDIDQEAERLHRLVDNLLELARAGAGPSVLRTELTSVDALIRRVVADATPRAGDRHLRVRASADLPHLSIDAARVEQVIRNLVDNAVKFSPSGTVIDVSAAVRAETLVVTVKDEGPGVAPEYRERVFDRFFRVQHAGVSGAGLGLAVCKRFVELHGGTIALDAGPGPGATFRFSLPLAQPGSLKDAVPC